MLRDGTSPGRDSSSGLSRALKPAVFIVGLLPFVYLVWAAVADRLGPNPAEALVRASGDWTLRSLCLVLAVTPLRVMFDLADLARIRRMEIGRAHV